MQRPLLSSTWQDTSDEDITAVRLVGALDSNFTLSIGTYQQQLAEITAEHSLLLEDQAKLAAFIEPYLDEDGRVIGEFDETLLLFKQGLDLRLLEYEEDCRRIQQTERRLQRHIDDICLRYDSMVMEAQGYAESRLLGQVKDLQRVIWILHSELDELRFQRDIFADETKRLRGICRFGHWIQDGYGVGEREDPIADITGAQDRKARHVGSFDSAQQGMVIWPRAHEGDKHGGRRGVERSPYIRRPAKSREVEADERGGQCAWQPPWQEARDSEEDEKHRRDSKKKESLSLFQGVLTKLLGAADEQVEKADKHGVSRVAGREAPGGERTGAIVFSRHRGEDGKRKSVLNGQRGKPGASALHQLPHRAGPPRVMAAKSEREDESRKIRRNDKRSESDEEEYERRRPSRRAPDLFRVDDKGREDRRREDRGREERKPEDRGREERKPEDRGREERKPEDRGREEIKSEDRGREDRKREDRGREDRREVKERRSTMQRGERLEDEEVRSRPDVLPRDRRALSRSAAATESKDTRRTNGMPAATARKRFSESRRVNGRAEMEYPRRVRSDGGVDLSEGETPRRFGGDAKRRDVLSRPAHSAHTSEGSWARKTERLGVEEDEEVDVAATFSDGEERTSPRRTDFASRLERIESTADTQADETSAAPSAAPSVRDEGETDFSDQVSLEDTGFRESETDASSPVRGSADAGRGIERRERVTPAPPPISPYYYEAGGAGGVRRFASRTVASPLVRSVAPSPQSSPRASLTRLESRTFLGTVESPRPGRRSPRGRHPSHSRANGRNRASRPGSGKTGTFARSLSRTLASPLASARSSTGIFGPRRMLSVASRGSWEGDGSVCSQDGRAFFDEEESDYHSRQRVSPLDISRMRR
ncbi:hypothetical protein TGME49_293550 [Toxoplasma gondii ME49]|uniref:Uncharacterized protein n=7 Tax=Toxoplasma gondii TaxID=5811 RepID=A0A125YSG1_TOXGV|nr:hypothetical protein TGME49_293550 [Toxoplasma gondii ME49]EPR57628.1 hypothetical protein TGGT1_293550 [Toxoplasma gondii GT1]ESS29251.1 hypothetical protein TGVEG_293550 [Toxoplasma gondii VEG]KFG35727.1 hypothetical protein TGP89_293550 [Toxoplasma gondii p89]RQX68764.1 hypothetical protein TGCAST_293550 [Toxoplasma gondii CAST]EPT32656.1 hypothetical protein TGME49_293550 [Toxoplasma gondii ME49]|eukprot:XP_018638618.1 hypothetical protein TGME49_293550 [Toxoplasma gondii ME49]